MGVCVRHIYIYIYGSPRIQPLRCTNTTRPSSSLLPLDLRSLGATHEGDLCRLIRRTIDLLRSFAVCRELSGRTRDRARAAAELLNRAPVFEPDEPFEAHTHTHSRHGSSSNSDRVSRAS